MTEKPIANPETYARHTCYACYACYSAPGDTLRSATPSNAGQKSVSTAGD